MAAHCLTQPVHSQVQRSSMLDRRIRPRIPAVANAADFAETSVPSGRVVVGGADTW